MATRFVHKGLPLEKSPFSNVAPFGVTDNGVLAVNRGAAHKGVCAADPETERVSVSRMVVLPATTTLTTASEADHGAVIVANTTAAVTLQLPTASAKTGLTITLTHGVLASSGGHVLRPNTADTIVFTSAAAGSAMRCTQATSVLGDCLTVVSDGGTKWYIKAKTGTWAAIA
jgi:hypothetical protein